MNLLILIADQGESEYLRDDLIRTLYGTAPNARDSFRRKTLYELRRQLPDDVLEADRNDLVHLRRAAMWVDSVEFAERANALLSQPPPLDEAGLDAAQDILALYKEPFLHHFQENEGSAQFAAWLRDRRQELTALYHQLLDRVTRFCLSDERRWGEAQRRAEEWRRSPGSSLRPLQFLIWLSARQRADSTSAYLAELRRREEAGEIPQGPTWEQWDRAVRQNQLLPLRLLLPDAPSPRPAPPPTAGDVERGEILDQLIALLVSPQKLPAFGLVGLPGSGKTELALLAIRRLSEQHPDIRIVRVELPTQMDYEVVTNSLLTGLGRQDLLPLDYSSKRQRLRQIAQTPHLVVVVDEGYSPHLADPEVLKTLLDLLAGARLMLVARSLPGFDHLPVELSGLTETQTRDFLIRRLGWLAEADDADLHALAVRTLGLPLMLTLIVSGLRSQRGRLPSLLHHLDASAAPDSAAHSIFIMYDRVLEWLWQYLTTNEKNILFAISLFAPEAGVTASALDAVLRGIAQTHIPGRLRQLVEMRLVKQIETPSDEPRFSLHPIVLDFVRRRSDSPSAYARHIRQAFVRYELDQVRIDADQRLRLEELEPNILLMLEMVILSDHYQNLQDRAVEALHRLYEYFEGRGLYSKTFALLTHVRDHLDLAQPLRLQTLFYIGKLAKYQAKFDAALEAFAGALAIAQRMDKTERYGSLLFHIGDAQIQSGSYADALTSLEEAARWAQSADQPQLLYAIWSNVAVCHFYQGDYARALEQYRWIAEQIGGDFDALPDSLKPIAQYLQNAIGATLLGMNAYAEALPYFQRSLALANSLGRQDQIAYSYLNLGAAYHSLKAYAAAQDSFAQGRAIAERIEHTPLIADFTWNQGALASSQMQHDRAFMLLRQSLIQIEDNHLTIQKPHALNFLAKAYLRFERADLAEKCFLMALRVPGVSLSQSAHALCGLLLSALMTTDIIGDDDVETTLTALEVLKPLIPVRSLALFALPPGDAAAHLDREAAALQHELDHLPTLARYRVVEALTYWLNERGAASDANAAGRADSRLPS
ncbi:MAG: tetratricopeptide repeat protein [Anaerolineae bacterium]|nr:tetratricopeptide repeat protein [Anaerolineae bacterium]